MALALYRKYRPATFAEVVGQEHVTDPLRTALAAGRINHAYLFSGPRGCGKTSSARILARSLNCIHGPTPDPCGECPSCIALAPEGPGSLDVVELDAASHGGVDDTRELRDRAFYMPAESRFRVFIIDEAHMVTTQGFNALLKIVEEPPEHLVFIFATTEPDKVLTTIRSRTHHYPFRLIPPAVLRSLLERLCAEEGVTVEPTVFPLVIQAGAGSARDSLSVLDQLLAGAGDEGVTYRSAVALLGVTDGALLDETVEALAAGDGASVFGTIDKVVEAGHDPRRFGADLLQRLRDLVILAAVPDAAAKNLIDVPADELVRMVEQALKMGAASLSRMAEVLHTGLIDMRGTTSPRLVLELMCARMLLPAASLADGALLQRLERLERRSAIAGDDPGPGTGQGVASVAAVDAGIAAPPARRPESPKRPVSQVASASVKPSGPASNESSGNAGGPDLGLPPPPPRRSTADRPAPPQSVAAPARTADETPATGPDLGLPPPPRSRTRPAAQSPAARPDPPVQRSESARPAAQKPAPEPAPASQPAPGPSKSVGPGPDVTDVRRVWPDVLAAVQRRRRTTQILLGSASVAALDANTLVLSMPAAGLARRVIEPDNVTVLRDALKEILGVDWAIRCEAPDSGPPGGSAGQGARTPTRGPTPPSSGPADRVPPPPEPPDEDIPDDYGDEPDPSAHYRVRDPHDVAIELLTNQLGAKQLDAEG